jgi:thiol:disulfide interchange protein DsbC
VNRIKDLLAVAATAAGVAFAASALAQAPAAPAKAAQAGPSITQTPATVRAAATAGAQNSASDESEIRRLMSEKFPGLDIVSISKSPYFGLYEVFSGDQLVYTDAKVTYVMVGNVIDPATRSNLTEERLQSLRAIAISDLPLDQSIKIVRGNGEKKVVVFSDADCPYCKQFEKTLAGMDNITAYVLLYPIDQLHPDAARKSRMIWCSPDRQKAWLDFMLQNKLPTNDGNCETPLPQLQALAQKYKVVATPTLVFMDGRVVPGALPRDRLEKELARADAAIAQKSVKN